VRILVLPPRGVSFPVDSPWMALIDGLRGAGHELSGYGKGQGPAEALVSLNHQSEVARLQSQFAIAPSRTALILLEPPVTAPMMYRRASLRLYQHVFAASRLWALRVDGEAFLWPQVLKPSLVTPEPGPFAASLINADKRSAVPGSLYGLRRSIIRIFDSSSTPLAVFGPGWGDSPVRRLRKAAKSTAKAARAGVAPNIGEVLGDLTLRAQHWRGPVDAKSQAFATAPTTIVVENSRDYVSEKLVDAICAGVAPLYVGPPLAEFGLPSEIAVECRADSIEILRALRALTKDRRAEVVAAGQRWLAGPESRQHDIHAVLRDLGRQIGMRLNTT